MNSILYLREIGSDFYRINEYIIISFYIYRKIRESFYLIEIIAEIHAMNIFKLKILIAINIVNINIMCFIIIFRGNFHITLNKDNTILICYTNLSKASLRRRLLMAPSDDSRCRGADEPQIFVYSIFILSKYVISPSDAFTDPFSHLSFTANIFKIKVLEAY
jgi:hypothetical protein